MTEFALKRSQNLLEPLRDMAPDFLFSWHFSETQLDDALSLMVFREARLSREHFLTHSRLMRESFRTALLEDLSAYFFNQESIVLVETDEEDSSVWGKIKLTLVAIGGTIFNICNGFDSSVSILNLFAGIPFWIVFLVGLVLSSVFVILFYGLDFVSISENLHVRLSQSRKLLDFFHHQAMLNQSLIDNTKQRLQFETNRWLEISLNSVNTSPDLNEVKKWLEFLHILAIHQEELNRVRHFYMAEKQQYYVLLLKWMMIALAGLLYFNSGFFVGQSFMMVTLSAFVATQVSLLSWPVLLVSCLVGLAALMSVFWFSDRISVEQLVCRWIGLDVDKIQQLPDDSVIKNNMAYLEGEKKNLYLHQGIQRRLLFPSIPSDVSNEKLQAQPLLQAY